MADIEVRCAECDAILEDAEIKSFGSSSRPSVALFVNPCMKCKADARAAGYDDGYNAGKEVGDEA